MAQQYPEFLALVKHAYVIASHAWGQIAALHEQVAPEQLLAGPPQEHLERNFVFSAAVLLFANAASCL
jgi:hypothetical protein